MVTLDHVASEAGVSKATVSRVINERGNVSAETVRIVREAMVRARYSPPAPKPLKGQPSQPRNGQPSALSAYALLVPEISADLYASLLRGFEAASQQHLHQTIVCNTNNNVLKQADDLIQLMHKRVSGIAIVPVASSPTPVAHIAVLESLGIPVVLLHRDVEGSDAPLILLPLKQIGHRAGRELIERGHRRIAMFTSESSSSASLHRAGIDEALRKQGLELPDDMVCYSPGAVPLVMSTLEESVAREVARLWSRPQSERPTAVYVTSSVIAEVLYMKFLEQGLRIGKDISLLAFGASQRSGAINSKLSSIVVDELQIGRGAVEVLNQARGADRTAGSNSTRFIRHAELSLAPGETLVRIG
jgi:GntR family transcriptional regulator, arabinose operon transcriptional repressor